MIVEPVDNLTADLTVFPRVTQEQHRSPLQAVPKPTLERMLTTIVDGWLVNAV